MGWYLKKSFAVGPLRLNFSQSGRQLGNPLLRGIFGGLLSGR